MSSTPEIETLCRRAGRCVRKGDYSQALELYRQAVALDESRYEIHEGMATASFLSDDYENAIIHFNRMTQLNPRQGKSLINLGAVYNRMGEYRKAIDVLRRGIPREKNNGQGFYNLGLAYRRLGQSAMAISAYREAIRIDPEMAEAHLNLANVYTDIKNFQQAITHYKQALEVRPGFDRARRGLEQVQQALKQAKRSISPFGRLVNAETSGPRATLVVEHQMTDEDRLADRKAVHSLAHDIETAARDLVKLLRNEFGPSLLALNRCVAQPDEAPSVISEAYDDFHAALNHCNEMRRRMKRKILELRSHEELMNTPKLKSAK